MVKWHAAAVLLATAMVTSSFASQAVRKHNRRFKGVPFVKEGTPLPPDQWFDQKLDHFDPTNTATWKQRYQTNDTFFQDKTNAPVFLMIGGEGAATAEWVVEGAWVTMYAKKFGALCFQLEHRFYGKSHPTEDMSTENLKYLSSEQALADLAFFIEAMNEKYGLTRANRWVSFGGSYPGSLSAWLRLKYPHLVHAAISTSGPLLAVADFKQFNEVVQASLATSSVDCVDQLKAAVKHFDKLVSTKEGAKIVNKKFKLCSSLDVNNEDDVDNLAESLSGTIQGVVQYNKDNRMSESPTRNITIDTICGILIDRSKGSPLDRYAAVNDLFLSREGENCLRYSFDEMIQELRETSWESSASKGERQWMYQTCVEFGFYQTSSTNKELFGPMYKLPFFIKQCKEIFGEKFNETLLDAGIKRTNAIYGALNIDVSRVLFVHGTIDPWHVLGVTSTRAVKAPAILVEGAAHCATMYPPGPSDSPQLARARRKILNHIGYWLMEDEFITN